MDACGFKIGMVQSTTRVCEAFKENKGSASKRCLIAE